MRPTKLSEIVGQHHLLEEDKLLYRAIKADKLQSLIFMAHLEQVKQPLLKLLPIRLRHILLCLMRRQVEKQRL